MKRDMDLVRKILLAGEATTEMEGRRRDLTVEGYDEATVAAHVEILKQAGFVDAHIQRVDGHGPLGANLYGLTWQGHEFLDRIRNESVWKETKRSILSRGLGFTTEVITAVATAVTKQHLGLPPG